MTKILGVAAGVLVLLLVGTGLLLKWSYEDNGSLKAGLADRDAVLQRKVEDAALSAGIIEKQQKTLATLDQKVFAAIQKVNHEPVSTTCARSLPMRDATRSLHELFAGDGQSPAGRQPAAALR